MTAATDLIAAERQRQMTAEGYTAEHDTGHALELAEAGVVYADRAVDAINDPDGDYSRGDGTAPPPYWPWDEEFWKPTGDPVRDLTKAGALLAAAIDSLIAERTSSDSRPGGVA